MAKKKAEPVNRREKKAVGHENGKRVAALRNRTNTIPSNGDLPASAEILPEPVTIGEAMRLAVAQLGETQIDDELAVSQLRQLSECYEDVVKRRAAFDAKNDEAKTAKKSLESATNLLLEKVRAFTHPTPLPLFDDRQAEQDLADMVDTDGDASDDDNSEAVQ